MDELWLAQMYNSYGLSSEQRREILKKIDIHYCLQDEPNQSVQTKYYIGITYLHVAARKLYYDCVHQLISQGVDLFKQTLGELKTPLLYTLNFHSVKSNFLWKMSGRFIHPMVDVLLSAQVKTGNALNPKDKEGMSHFHLACVVNHIKAVEFFLKAGESVNQATNNDHELLPGYTALHFAIRYSSIKAAEILIKIGADVHLKDSKGKSSLHLLMERLINSTDYITMGKQACCFICREEIKKIESIVHFILKNKNTDQINFTDDTGFTAFHMACALTDKSIAATFLTHDIDINSSINDDATFWPGFTPLHFAACFNVETVKLLISKGGDLTKSAAGKSPLDLCMERYAPEVIHSILSCKSEFKNITLSDGSTSLLDVLLLMNDCDKFNNYLRSLEDVNISVPHDSPIWPGNTLLHLSILMNEKTKTLKDCYNMLTCEECSESSKKFYNCTEKEELAYWKRIVICLVHNCSLAMKNADGLTPIHLAFRLRKANIVDKLMNSCKTDVADSSNVTHFHIACVIGKTTFVERLLTEGVDVNSPVNCNFEWFSRRESVFKNKNCLVTLQANCTPLHSAVIFENKEVIELLLQNGANVYAQDALGLTPIHYSLKFDTKKLRPIAQLLLSKAPNLKEVVSKQNLSHLHVAAYANDADAVDKLLMSGSDVNAAFNYEGKESKDYQDELSHFSDETPLYIAVKEKSGEAVRALIRGGADISKKPDCWFKETPFIRGLTDMDTDSTKHLIKKAKREYKGIVGSIDENKVTMLHVACGCFDLMWAKKLLEIGADVNARVRDDDDYENDDWRGETPLHVVIRQAYYMSDKLPKNVLNLVKLLLKYGADVTIKDGWGSTCIHSAHEYINEIKKPLFSAVANLLLRSQISYNVNPIDHRGFSHFHVACVRNDMETVKRFLKNGIDVNHNMDYLAYHSDSGYTPLHFALKNRHLDLARFLMIRGANVKAEACNGNTPLHVAVMKNCMDLDLLGTLYRKGADFSAKNLKDMTPLMCLLLSKGFTLEQLDFFLECGSQFDVTHVESCEGIIGLAVKNALSNEREQVFQKLIGTDDVQSAVSNGFNAIQSIVSVNQDGCLTLNFYVHAIEQLMKMGCNIDQQNEKGRAPIHDAVYFNNLEAVETLVLLLGADLNIVDNKNKSPLSTLVIAHDKVMANRRCNVVRILLNHAWKIKFLNLDMKSSVEKDLLTLAGNKCVDHSNQSRWKNEFKKMESVTISSFLTAKSFMYQGVNNYPLMELSERKQVDDFFESSQKIMLQFPELGSFLNMQYRKAVFKLKM